MGGVGGHMSHLYENPELTFKEMKDVFIKASNGELVGTEKTDGQNLFISYSVKNGEARAARNKGNIKTGGLNVDGLIDKFADHGNENLVKSFGDAFMTFEKAVRSLDPEEQMAIFGSDANIYYNAEIQDPRTANIISYDTKTLNIHQVGHAQFNKETGKVDDVDVSKNVKALDKALERMQQSIQDDEYNVQKNAVRNLQALSSDEHANTAITRLEQLINGVGLSDSATIADYTVSKIVPYIDSNVELEDGRKILLLKRILGVEDEKLKKKPGFNDIVRGLPKEEIEKKQVIRDIVKNSKNLLKQIMVPLEDIVHDFSVEMLRGLQSVFVLDNPKEVMRLRQETAHAIATIENSGNEEAIAILQQQMRKLKSVEDISTAAEGFVFDYGGKTYKFTGNFAPMNQILGLFKYGRGGSGPLQSLGEGEDDGELCEKTIAVIPGKFKPPHRGHLDMVKHYANIADHVVVLISPLNASEAKEFKSGGQADVTTQQSVSIWKIYVEAAGLSGKVSVDIPKMRSPVRAAYEFTGPDGPLEAGSCVILGASTKGGDQSRFARNVQSYAKEGVNVLDPMKFAFDPKEGISATDFRKALHDNDLERIKYFLPQEASNRLQEILTELGIVELTENKKKGDFFTVLYGLIEEAVNEDFQKKMKKRLSKSHSWLLDQGTQDPGSTFGNKRVPDKSNAFIAKENEEIEEVSAPAFVGGEKPRLQACYEDPNCDPEEMKAKEEACYEDPDCNHYDLAEISVGASVEGHSAGAWAGFKDEDNEEERKKTMTLRRESQYDIIVNQVLDYLLRN
jgi:cytidyltransferase-like protein